MNSFDPLIYRYVLSENGEPAGAFMQAEGMASSDEIVSYRHDGQDVRMVLPGSEQKQVVLKRGELTKSFFESSQNHAKKTVVLTLMDDGGSVAVSCQLTDAWVSGYEGLSMRASDDGRFDLEKLTFYCSAIKCD